MSALVGLGPLLDPAALWTIAQQVWQARERLAIRTGSNIPSASQLLVALRMYINAQDRGRSDALPGLSASREGGASDQPGEAGRSVDVGAIEEMLRRGAATRPSMDTPPAVGSDEGSRDAAVVPLSPLEELAHYMMMADAAYADGKEHLLQMLDLVGGEEGLLEARWVSSKYHPAYYIAYDARSEAIVIAIRGSKEIADFITNLSCDTAPFHSGYGHSGIVQSAQNVAALIVPNLFKYLDAHRPRNGLVVIGHSLGGAIASVLSLMIRTGSVDDHVHLAQPPPRRVASQRASVNANAAAAPARTGRAARRGGLAQARESDAEWADFVDPGRARTAAAKDIASNARCFAFAAPPSVSPDVAEAAKSLGVTTIVHAYDMVPRLSAASLDRLLVAISEYNWQGEMQGNFEDGLRNFLTQAMGAAAAPAIAATVANIGPNLLGPLVRGIQRSAQNALTAPAPAAPGPNGERRGLHPAQKIGLGFLVVAGGFLSHQFFNEDARQAQQQQGRGSVPAGRGRREYPFAARFGLSTEQVEEALIPNQPRVLHLPGRIFHLDRPFTRPDQYSGDSALPPVTLVERDPEMFLDVVATAWMLHDHSSPNMLMALSSLHPPDARPGSSITEEEDFRRL